MVNYSDILDKIFDNIKSLSEPYKEETLDIYLSSYINVKKIKEGVNKKYENSQSAKR